MNARTAVHGVELAAQSRVIKTIDLQFATTSFSGVWMYADGKFRGCYFHVPSNNNNGTITVSGRGDKSSKNSLYHFSHQPCIFLPYQNQIPSPLHTSTQRPVGKST